MATVSKVKGKNGTSYYVQLSPGENPQRPKITLGACGLKDANTARGHIEKLANRVGNEIAPSTQEWICKLPESIRVRLERLGLVEARGSQWTVSAFVANYIEQRADVKEQTRRKWRDVESKLNAFFRGDSIADVTVQHAKNFRMYLQTTVGLSDNTIRRHIGIARQFFNAAVEDELIKKNPFRGQAVSVRPNEARFFFVTPEIAKKVLEACPDAQWRLIFGLVRFGGLRCPSEVLHLKWQDIDFDKQRFVVHASKTEHHADGGIRTVPMFPELKPLFQDAFDEAPEGAVYCVEKSRDGGVNWRTQMERIIRQAGLEPWPKLFQNCRSTRETELFKSTGANIKAVCKWLGNSPQVAMAHYAQLTEADMKEAAEKSVLEEAENTVQNSVQTDDNSDSTELHDDPDACDVSPCLCGSNVEDASPCNTGQNPSNWAIRDSNPGPAD